MLLKTKLTCLLTGLLITAITNSQTTRKSIVASYAGFSAYSHIQIDAFSFIANQASLAQLKNSAAGVYGERRFMLKEMSSYSAVVAVPTSSGNLGLQTNYTGSNNYNETKIGLAYARQLGSKLDIGAQFNYQAIKIPVYGNVSAISFEIGTILHITEKFNAGVHINNPFGGKFGKDQQEKLPSIYTAGFGYDVSEKVLVSGEIVKEENEPVTVNAGIQYNLLPQVFARAGIASATSSMWFGIGLLLKSFRVDVTSNYHPQLGITPGLLFVFNFKEKKN